MPIISSIRRAGVRTLRFFHTLTKRRKPERATENKTPISSRRTSRVRSIRAASKSECLHPEPFPCRGFPIELWFLIISLALQPRFLDTEFMSQNIQFVHYSLIDRPYHCVYRTEIKSTRASLRLVCKYIQLIVDEVASQYQESPWIWKYNPFNPRDQPCIRLDTRVGGLDELLNIDLPYGYDVRILTLCVTEENGATMYPTLFSLIAIPWTLTVLHLSFPGSMYATKVFPTSILNGLISLKTLSITASYPLYFSGVLFMPQVLTLFLTCYPHPHSNISEWLFPNLKNLAIDIREWPKCNENGYCGDECPSCVHSIRLRFGKFIRRHRKTIKSLQMIPLIPTVLSSSSRWNSLPLLETLATDLVKYKPSSYPPLFHVIHISIRSYTKQQLSKALLSTVRGVPSLQSLAITGDPSLSIAIEEDYEGEEDLSIINELEQLCRIREIRIIGPFGSDACCISKAFNALTRKEEEEEEGEDLGDGWEDEEEEGGQ